MLDAFRRKLRRARSLRSIMPLPDALRIAFNESGGGVIKTVLSPIGREVVIRLGTSDMSCVEKIFLSEEYRSPFAIQPDVIVDAGANIGMATLFFAHQFPSARIVAIEPEESNFRILSQNCAGLQNISLLKGALWSASTSMTIADRNAEAWAFSVVEASGADSGAERIKGISVPDIMKIFKFDRIDVLKLDIEGAERELFSVGAEEWIEKVSVIIIELHDRYVSGCAEAFYSALASRRFAQEIKGENIFVQMSGARRPAARLVG
jgi:FkbM family methyltransferase